MTDEYLIAFLYVLIRDEVTPGSIEQVMEHVEKKLKKYGNEAMYSNQFLAEYARSLANRLLKS